MGFNDVNESIEEEQNLREGLDEVEEFSEEEQESRDREFKKINKDEKKAKKKEFILSDILIQILKSNKYDSVRNLIIKMLENNIPANILVGVLSLVYIDASNKIRDIHNEMNPDKIDYIEFEYRNNPDDFITENNLPELIQLRLSEWIQDIYSSAIEDASEVFLKRCLEKLNSDEKILVTEFISEIYNFFLKNLNIPVTSSNSKQYANYIIGEILKKIK